MWEIIANLISFIVGVVLSALTLIWKYRRQIEIVVDWLIEAQKDGRITKEELAYLLEQLGKSLKE